MDFGIKKLISTSYAPESNAHGDLLPADAVRDRRALVRRDEDSSQGQAVRAGAKDVNGDGVINIDDLQWEYLEGDGDFRSAEVTALRDEADIVITNPPFSLFREFLPGSWRLARSSRSSATCNAITYKEVFPLIQANRLWLGATASPRGDGSSESPTATRWRAQRSSHRLERLATGSLPVKGVRWFTNIDHGRRHEPLQLMTMADNIKFSKHKEVRGVGYRRYDNYDAIEVPFIDAIPSDYDGVMGVPITFPGQVQPGPVRDHRQHATTSDMTRGSAWRQSVRSSCAATRAGRHWRRQPGTANARPVRRRVTAVRSSASSSGEGRLT